MNRFCGLYCYLIVSLILCGNSSSFAQLAGKASVPEVYREGFDSITTKQAENLMSVLAGPNFAGRGTGQPGYIKAAHWVAGKAAEFGLEPMGEGGTYFQMVPMSALAIDDKRSKLTGPNGLELVADKNFNVSRFADQIEVSGEVVFVSLAGETPTLEENQLRDKIVIYVTDLAAAGRAPMVIARQSPAAAFRLVESINTPSSQILKSDGKTRSTSVSGLLARSAAEKIVKAVGGQLAWLDQVKAGQNKVYRSNQSLNLQLLIKQATINVPNVVAWLEGSDPRLSHEYVVIGAHLDHLGNQNDSIFYGADDNGSGSTAVLSIARALTANPVRPKRSVLFTWFAAEELGLVGSKHYCENPLRPLDKMVCMLNIDMVGRNEESPTESATLNSNSIHLIGSRKGDPALHEVIIQANNFVNLEFEYDEESIFTRSDQASFFEKGTSVAFLFGGFHPDYHQPTDKPEAINFEKIVAAARLFYLTIYFAADHGRFIPPAPVNQ
ncbi:MAG: M20/M25/M40 family metallo-hydrolase [Pirellulaceae bacterium]